MGKKNLDTVGNTTSIGKTLSKFGIGNPKNEEEEVIEIPEEKAANKKTKMQLVSMMVEPKNWENLKIIARIEGKSASALVNEFINKEVEKRAKDIASFEKIAK